MLEERLAKISATECCKSDLHHFGCANLEDGDASYLPPLQCVIDAKTGEIMICVKHLGEIHACKVMGERYTDAGLESDGIFCTGNYEEVCENHYNVIDRCESTNPEVMARNIADLKRRVNALEISRMTF